MAADRDHVLAGHEPRRVEDEGLEQAGVARLGTVPADDDLQRAEEGAEELWMTGLAA